MESSAVFAGLQPNHHLYFGPSHRAAKLFPSQFVQKKLSYRHLLQLQKRFNFCSSFSTLGVSLPARNVATESAEFDWDNLGFGFIPTDYMYNMKCSEGEDFSNGELQRFGNIELSPSAGILNYGQGLLEGLKAYRKHDGSILLFRPEENARRLRTGAERMCMPSPTVEQFVEAVTIAVLANERWIPPSGKGSLYVRPLLMGSGSVLGVAPAPEYTFLIYVSPVGNYFQEGLAPIHLLIETEMHRATLGGIGGVKTIGNYAGVMFKCDIKLMR